jgi:predicted porin
MTFPRLALACLAIASGAVHAQTSGVTIYGRLDAGVTKQNSGTSALSGGNGLSGPAASLWELRHGSEPRLGFRGVEDLGDGLKAGFQLEHRFRVDTGAADAIFWEGRSYVYLERQDLGTVYLGREYVPAFWPALKTDPWLWDTVGSPGLNHQLAGYRVDNHARANNTVGYKSPALAGVTVNLAVAAGEGARPRETGANIEYANGPLYIGAGYDHQSGDDKVALVGAYYSFGAVRPSFTYIRSTVKGVDATNLTLAARMSMGQHIVKLAAARLNPDGDNNSTTKVGLGYEYTLSKRTALYTDIGSSRQQGNLAGQPRTRTTAYDMGVRHDF